MAQPAGAEWGRKPSSRCRAVVALMVAAAALGLGLGPLRADGPMSRYHGIHPLSPHQGAFCYIDAPHMHRLPPPDQRVYLVLKGDVNLFIGDPAALGYDGPKFGYYGPHPLAVPEAPGPSQVAPVFCYITGPHYHDAPQPPSPMLVEKAGVTWYLGPLPPPADPGRVWINEAHPIAGYVSPKVDLSMAPPGYHPFAVMPPPVAPAAVPTPPPGKGKPGQGTRAGAPARREKAAVPAAQGAQP